MGQRALITGVTGQDGAWLCQLLERRGFDVHGIARRASTPNTWRLETLGVSPTLHTGDVTDAVAVDRIVSAVAPDFLFHLAAQSDVGVSFANPLYTASVNALGTLHVLEAARRLAETKPVRVYQASTSELYGDAPAPFDEQTPMRPRSPYAAAKLHAYWAVRNYREAYGLHASNGILFNHESSLRGERFVTRKVSIAAARISEGRQECVELGNLDARRDWGHARDYVDAMLRIVEHETADDWVVATGAAYTVRAFVAAAFARVGLPLSFDGSGTGEVGTHGGRVLVRINPDFYRPTEVDVTLGDATKARTHLGWQPQTGFAELVHEMVDADLERVRRMQ